MFFLLQGIALDLWLWGQYFLLHHFLHYLWAVILYGKKTAVVHAVIKYGRTLIYDIDIVPVLQNLLRWVYWTGLIWIGASEREHGTCRYIKTLNRSAPSARAPHICGGDWKAILFSGLCAKDRPQCIMRALAAKWVFVNETKINSNSRALPVRL